MVLDLIRWIPLLVTIFVIALLMVMSARLRRVEDKVDLLLDHIDGRASTVEKSA